MNTDLDAWLTRTTIGWWSTSGWHFSLSFSLQPQPAEDINAADGSIKKGSKKEKSKKPKGWSDEDIFGDLQVAAKTKSSKTKQKKKDGMK